MIYLNGMQGINNQSSVVEHAVQGPEKLPSAKQSTETWSSRLNRQTSRLVPHRSSRLKEKESKFNKSSRQISRLMKAVA